MRTLSSKAESTSDAIIIWEGGGNDPDSGRHAALDMLEKHPELTALLCFSDQLAIGAAQAGLRLGRRLPDELSIVGFDDIPRAATWDPPLTTVRQPLIDKGRVAAELLMEQIEVGGTRRYRASNRARRASLNGTALRRSAFGVRVEGHVSAAKK